MLESISLFGEWGISLTRPMLESLRRVLSISYSSRSGIRLVPQVGTLSYTPVVEYVWSYVGCRIYLIRPVPACVVDRREDSSFYTLRAAVCLLVKSFSYTPRAGICLVVRR